MPLTNKRDALKPETAIAVSNLPLSSIAHRCARETDAFFARRLHDPRFCFELFRRAIVEQVERAWHLIYDQYRALVASWAQRHSSFASCGEEVQFIVNCAFDRMWSALTPTKFLKFPNLRSILRYLQMCVHSVILDLARKRQTPVIGLDQAEPDLAGVSPGNSGDRPYDRLIRNEFWQSILARLKDEQERCVVYASFVQGLKPREICACYAHLFADVRQVYRVKENVLARFRRDPELRAVLQGDA